MTKNYLLLLIVALLIVYSKPPTTVSDSPHGSQSLEAIGTVVAYDQLGALTNITSVLQSQVLIIRIARRIKGRENQSYIKVVYEYAANESSLPQNIFDGNSQWRFVLKRNLSCDSTLKEMKATKTKAGDIMVPRLKFTREIEILEDEVNLPCYVLKPGKYRMRK